MLKRRNIVTYIRTLNDRYKHGIGDRAFRDAVMVYLARELEREKPKKRPCDGCGTNIEQAVQWDEVTCWTTCEKWKAWIESVKERK